MASTDPYVSRQAVRQDAGFQHPEENEALVGVVDGSNKTFMTVHKPIVDRDFNDHVDVDDVTVYQDGVPVEVASVNQDTGVIVLVDAPDADTEITCFYAHSQLTDFDVDTYIKQATGIVHRALRSNGIATPFSEDNENQEPYYATIQMIVTMYAAGLALIRDYGSNADTEETSKDGYKKLKTAKDELLSLVEALKLDELIPSSGSQGSGGRVEVTNQGKIFSDLSGGIVDGERQGFSGRSADPHEAFFRGR